MTRKDFFSRSGSLLVPSLFVSSRPRFQAAEAALGMSSLPVFSVVQYGANADGMTKTTRAIQSAIDAAAEKGGTVYFPPGKYILGTVRLKSFVTLYLDAGATLLASPDNSDFDRYEKLDYNSCSDRETTYFNYALIRAENARNIGIHGRGIVDGNRTRRGGPKPIALKRCQQVSIRDITMQNAPNYNISMLGCDYVDIDGVTIFNGYADGIDPDCCRYVRIANCFIESADDAIVPKASPSLGEVRPTEDFTVTNCVLTTPANGLKFGTESSGDFKNVTFSNCVIFSRREKWKRGPRAGIALESVDGSHIEGVSVTNIVMDDVHTPIFIRLGNRGRCQGAPTPGSLHHISISNIVATRSLHASSITGIPGHNVRDVTLQNINICSIGGGAAMTQEVPEVASKYPEGDMFGPLPAYGLYCRHVRGLHVEDLSLQLDKPDYRPAVVADDIKELDLLTLRAEPCAGDQPVVLLRDAGMALLQGARALPSTKKFLEITGARSQKVHLIANDLNEAEIPFTTSGDAKPEALLESGNLMPRTESAIDSSPGN